MKMIECIAALQRVREKQQEVQQLLDLLEDGPVSCIDYNVANASYQIHRGIEFLAAYYGSPLIYEGCPGEYHRVAFYADGVKFFQLLEDSGLQDFITRGLLPTEEPLCAG